MKQKLKVTTLSLCVVSLSLFGVKSFFESGDLRSLDEKKETQKTSDETGAQKSPIYQTPPVRNMKKLLSEDLDVKHGLIRVKFTEESAARIMNKSGNSGIIQSKSATQAVRVGIRSLDGLLSKTKAQRMTRVFPFHPRYEKRQRSMGLHLWYEIQVDSTQSVIALCSEFGSEPSIQIVEPVAKAITFQVDGKVQDPTNDDITTDLISIKPTVIRAEKSQSSARRSPFSKSDRNYENNPPVNDPDLLKQWHYYNYGQVENNKMGPSYPSADISLFDAWKVTMGNPNVIVSVHDQGVDVKHPDIQSNLWVNTAELNGTEGVDDDGNGFIDDIHGVNFANKTGGIMPGSHGTHVAGTVSAVNNNGIGVAGVAGGSGNNDGARIMSCEILGSSGNYNIPASYVYAANNGAVISQNSWGYNMANYYEEAVLDAIDYFIRYAGLDDNDKPLPNTPMVGGIVIFAAGNDNENSASSPRYPGYYASCIDVAASGPWNEKASYTNYGPRIDITAPGGHTNIQKNAGVYSTYSNNQYEYLQGTSMAAPHVSGVAALILSAYGHSAYTPEMLKNRLYTGATSWEELNPENVGKMGCGLLNAAMSLKPDSGIAPDNISDLNAESVGYDFIQLAFTAPKDQDNDHAISYEIAYRKGEQVTPENFDKCEKVFAKAQSAGSKEKIIIDQLEGVTDYYFAVRSYDMWSNASGLSNILKVATLTAPKATFPQDTLKIAFDQAKSESEKSIAFEIGNIDGGDLRYSLSHALYSDPKLLKQGYNQANGKISPAKKTYEGIFGSDGSETFYAASQITVNQDNFTCTHIVAPFFPTQMINGQVSYSDKIMVARIYKGGITPDKGEYLSGFGFIIPQKVFNLNVLFGTGRMPDLTIELLDPLAFDKGEKFWIVFEFAKGFYMPMTFNGEANSSANSELYSVDNKNWNSLDDFNFKDVKHPYAFRVKAINCLSDLPKNLISFNPNSGFVSAGNKSSVNLKAIVSDVVDGAYSGKVYASTNDPVNSRIIIPFRVDVSGHRSAFRSQSTLKMGSVVQTLKDTAYFTVHNDSLGYLRIDSINSTKPQFAVYPNKNIKIAPQDSAKFRVVFTAPGDAADGTSNPDSTGTFISKLIFSTNTELVKHQMIVDATAIPRPKISLSTDSVYLDQVKQGEYREFSVELKNTGKYRLDYRIDTDRILDYDYADMLPGVSELFGKKYLMKAYEFNSIQKNADAIKYTDKVRGTQLFHIDLPFKFKSYGKEYTSLTLAGDGRIMLGKREEWTNGYGMIGIPNSANPATIFPLHSQGKNMIGDQEGDAYVLIQSDKVIFEFTKMGTMVGQGKDQPTATIRVQAILKSNGEMEFWYKDYNGDRQKNFSLSALIAVSDTIGHGGLGVWCVRDPEGTPRRRVSQGVLEGFGEGTIYWEHGVPDTLNWRETPAFITKGQTVKVEVKRNKTYVKAINPKDGYILPGESQSIRFGVNIDEVTREGKISKVIPVFTNDPYNAELFIKLEMDVVAEAVPVLSTDTISFGPVGKDVESRRTLSLSNEGGRSFSVRAYLKNGTDFSLDETSEMQCNALSSLNFTTRFTPSEEKDYEDELIVEIKNGETTTTSTVVLKGYGTKRPLMSVKTVEENALVFDKRKGQITMPLSMEISNEGDLDLEYNLLLPEWLKDVSSNTLSGIDNFGYYWVDNQVDESAVPYKWEWENPERFDPLFKENDRFYFSKELKLPFEFSYYGDSYTKVYANMSGMIYFDRGDMMYNMDANAYGSGNIIIPKADYTNGFISALAGKYDLPNCYYETLGEGDNQRFVVTWDVRSILNPARVLFQTILYKDGRIKYQYKDVEKATYRNQCTVGIENRKGDDGLMIDYNNAANIKNFRAILISPCQKLILKPGETKRINLLADVSNVWDGSYKEKIQIFSNDPVEKMHTTSVSLRIIGETLLQYEIDGIPVDSLNFGEVIRSLYPETMNDKYYKVQNGKQTRKLTIRNVGTRTAHLYNGSPLNNQYLELGILPKQIGFTEPTYTLAPNDFVETTLSLEAFNTMGSVAQMGQQLTSYIFQDRVTKKDEADLYGYTEVGYNMMGRPSYWYKKDSIFVAYHLRDIAKESLTTSNKVVEKIFQERDGQLSVDFEIENSPVSADIWKQMHKTNSDKVAPTITDQSPLRYKVDVQELSKSAYEASVTPEIRVAQEAEKEEFRQRYLKSGRLNILQALKSEQPNERINHSNMVDSLGYFKFDGYLGGFFAPSSDLTFKNYTRLYSGENGFNITHIKAMMAKMENDVNLDYAVDLEILIGKDLPEAISVYSGSFTPEFKDFEAFEDMMIPLNAPVYIYPHQFVWVKLTNKVNTCVASVYWNKYPSRDFRYNFIGDNGQVGGLLDDLTGYYAGWDVALFSENRRENVKDWYSLSHKEGALNAGEKQNVNFSIDMKDDASEMNTRYMRIALQSNDVYPFGKDSVLRCGKEFNNLDYGSKDKVVFDEYIREKDYIYVKVRLNQAPEIYQNLQTFTIPENNEHIRWIKVIDQEKDAISSVNVICKADVSNPEGIVAPEIQVGEAKQLPNDTLAYPITIRTGFDAAGLYSMEVTASDDKNKESVSALRFVVSNVNRAPEYKGSESFEIEQGGFYTFDLNKLFIDPDGQELSFSVTQIDSQILAAMIDGSMLSLNSWKTGNGSITINTVDPEGESIQKILNFTVKEPTSTDLDDISLNTASVVLYPNPAIELLICEYTLSEEGITEFIVYDMDGKKLVQTQQSESVQGLNRHTLNVSDLAAGNYLLQIRFNNKPVSVKQFVKSNK